MRYCREPTFFSVRNKDLQTHVFKIRAHYTFPVCSTTINALHTLRLETYYRPSLRTQLAAHDTYSTSSCLEHYSSPPLDEVTEDLWEGKR